MKDLIYSKMSVDNTPKCLLCANYLGLLRCKAFKSGIPDVFVNEDLEHDIVVQEQSGTFIFEFDENSKHIDITDLCDSLQNGQLSK